MKELGIEEKAKAYDEAIKRVENIKTGKCKTTFMFTEGLFEHIFPELKESEDERIRKAIVSFIEEMKGDFGTFGGIKLDDMVVWLEKQGDKNSQVILPAFTFDDILALQCCMETVKKVQMDKDLYEKLNDLHGRVYDAYHLEKQAEQKSYASETMNEKGDFDNGFTRMMEKEQKSVAWSEEDETVLNNLIYALANDRISNSRDEYVNWLKSLRTKNTWKPSGFHLECISDAIAIYEERGINAIGLKEILEELKKLKG